MNVVCSRLLLFWRFLKKLLGNHVGLVINGLQCFHIS